VEGGGAGSHAGESEDEDEDGYGGEDDGEDEDDERDTGFHRVRLALGGSSVGVVQQLLQVWALCIHFGNGSADNAAAGAGAAGAAGAAGGGMELTPSANGNAHSSSSSKNSGRLAVLRHVFGVLDLRQPPMLGGGGSVGGSGGSGDGGSDTTTSVLLPPDQLSLTRQGSNDEVLERKGSAGAGNNSPVPTLRSKTASFGKGGKGEREKSERGIEC
jgi:hypothetical protein